MKRSWTVLTVVAGMFSLIACEWLSLPAAQPPAATPTAFSLSAASFSGSIDIDPKASSGSISFAVTEDGSAITNVEITLTDLKCDGLTAGWVHELFSGLEIAIENGEFQSIIPAVGREVKMYKLESSPSAFPTVASLESAGQIDGRFHSATQASGTIKLAMWVVMTDRACEMGEFAWNAEAQ